MIAYVILNYVHANRLKENQATRSVYVFTKGANRRIYNLIRGYLITDYMSIVGILASSGKDKREETIQSVNSEKERVTLLFQRLQLENKSFRINQS
jgi:hypothetical protein